MFFKQFRVAFEPFKSGFKLCQEASFEWIQPDTRWRTPSVLICRPETILSGDEVGPPSVASLQPEEFALHAYEFSPSGFAVFVEPVGEDQARQVVLRIRPD